MIKERTVAEIRIKIPKQSENLLYSVLLRLPLIGSNEEMVFRKLESGKLQLEQKGINRIIEGEEAVGLLAKARLDADLRKIRK